MKGWIIVPTVNLAAISVSLADVEMWLRIISLGCAIAYTVYRWRRDRKDSDDATRRDE